jgi:diguanylate cyclase (GGDEF)-like protein
MSKQIKLSEITHNTKKKIYTKEIVMPSDYLILFQDEAKELSKAYSTDFDLEDMIKEELCNDLRKSSKLIEEMECVLKSVSFEIDKTLEAFHLGDESCLISAREEIKKLSQKVNILSQEIYRDELTELFNRKWFFKEFLIEEKYPKKDGIICFIDLNGLKQINDSFGHKLGDKTIAYLGNFLKSQISNSNIVRFAGDEFILLFDEKEMKEVEDLMEIVNENLQKKQLKTMKSGKDHVFNISFSFGLSKYESGVSILSAIENADENMYIMKNIRKEIR